jgi:SAM-dependent methyltransferase
MADTSESLSFWDEEAAARRHINWMADPAVRRYLNTLIGGSEHDWPFNWFVRYLNGRRFSRALSIGCGTGALERDLIRRGIADRVDAFDGSTLAVLKAKTEAIAEGYGDAIHYFATDFNEPALPASAYDAVFFHHSLHHVAKLEKLMRAILHTLKPGGLMYLDEYVGPSRAWWTDERFQFERDLFFELVPPEARRVPTLPLPVVFEDPSEGVRSGEIAKQLALGFDLLETRGYGGNLLSVICPAVLWEHAPEGLLDRLIAEETRLLAGGTPPYLAIIVATPKSGFRKAFASGHYFLMPKIRRVGREIGRVLARFAGRRGNGQRAA